MHIAYRIIETSLKNDCFKKIEESLEILELESLLATIHESG
jgi:hypothetical protein